MADRTLHAYIDEAGQRARTPKSSKHFVMSAVVLAGADLQAATDALATLRTDIGRAPGDTIHWRNVRNHSQRVHIAKTLGSLDVATVSSVVVCKDHLTGEALDDDHAYLYTLRYLVERLSWLARDQDRILTWTVAHIVRFKLETLRAYEAMLRALPDCQIAWPSLDPKGGRIDQPSRVELLQWADVAASASFAAFEPDVFGNTEDRYLQHIAPRLYRRKDNLLSYGLKIHPGTARAAYPWAAAL